MSIIGLLVGLILIGLVFWAVRAIGAAFAIPQPSTSAMLETPSVTRPD
jgi:uncharacterized membrane protein YwzB